MDKVSIVTFISGKEQYRESFSALITYLKQHNLDVEGLVLCDDCIEVPKALRCLKTEGMTKYRRIQLALQEAEGAYLLFVDNDITPNFHNIHNFIQESIARQSSLGWGKIGCSSTSTFTEKLVFIDKLISHHIIRPYLWKNKVGISIPGQVFLLKRNAFLGYTTPEDTVYDDLALGVAAKKNSVEPYICDAYLGTEQPKRTLLELFKQRRRWAQGFAETAFNNRHNSMLKYVLLHGAAYHYNWLLSCLWLATIYKLGSIWGLLFTFLVTFRLTQTKEAPFSWSLAYIMIFPIIHILWSFFFLGNLLHLYTTPYFKKHLKLHPDS